MFKTFINTTAELIQDSKKFAIETFVKHEELAKSLTEFVDTQTEYTKKAIDASLTTVTDVYGTVTSPKFFTDTVKTMKEAVHSVYPQKKEK